MVFSSQISFGNFIFTSYFYFFFFFSLLLFSSVRTISPIIREISLPSLIHFDQSLEGTGNQIN